MKNLYYGLATFAVLLLATLGFVHSSSAQCGGCHTPPEDCTEGYLWNPDTCQCEVSTPIILDLSGQGFFLTSAQSGVAFDITGTAHPIQISWTAPGADNGFLCLPDAAGKCDDGKDLFGNFTPQPKSANPNGFAALAVYDQPTNGGNGDGVIDARDKIFASLRLWVDTNHDGISQPDELFTLPSKGVNSISLNYRASLRRDQYGNLFRYRARVNPDNPNPDPDLGRIAYDVFLTIAN